MHGCALAMVSPHWLRLTALLVSQQVGLWSTRRGREISVLRQGRVSEEWPVGRWWMCEELLKYRCQILTLVPGQTGVALGNSDLQQFLSKDGVLSIYHTELLDSAIEKQSNYKKVL